jgi:uncharacterized peroxidase-related enzyme
VDRFAGDWRTCGLDEPTLALLAFAEQLTLDPASVGRDSLRRMREAGWDDRAITDAVQVCAFFNYINRIAEGLGVDPEPWLDDTGRPR